MEKDWNFSNSNVFLSIARFFLDRAHGACLEFHRFHLISSFSLAMRRLGPVVKSSPARKQSEGIAAIDRAPTTTKNVGKLEESARSCFGKRDEEVY
jgi:hypothetical protein